MEPDTDKEWKESVNEWIKDIDGKLGDIKIVGKVLKDTMDNTEHNYELNQELRQEVEELKQEIKLLKIIQLTMLKPKPARTIKKTR